MLSDAFPPFPVKMKGGESAVVKYVVQSGLLVRHGLKIHAADGCQVLRGRQRRLDVKIIYMGNGSLH